jgi:hypothetical protein
MDTPAPLPVLPQVGVNQHSPAEAKIALFRSLFHGREDVYPRRFESRKTGRAGYSPDRRAAGKIFRAVILSEDFMIRRLTTVHENGLPGASQEHREGRGFSPAVTLHALTPAPLPLAGEGGPRSGG